MENESTVKFIIEGDPGEGNTFTHIQVEHAVNVINTPGPVENTFVLGPDGELQGMSTKEANAVSPQGKRLKSKLLREMLKEGQLDTTNLQQEIMKYVIKIRPFVKEDKDKLYMQFWERIMKKEPFKVDLFDPGMLPCHFNRILVANILHYLDDKGFYKDPYNQSLMTRAVENDADHPVRRGFRTYPSEKHCQVIDDLLKELQGR